MAFFPRSSAPPQNDPNWISQSWGGRNRAVPGPWYGNGYVLPNCVGQIHGRWMECYGECWVSTNNAETAYDKSGVTSYNDHYLRGQTPVIGAIICWDDTAPTSADYHGGHVAIVESINYDSNGNVTSVYCSESGYNNFVWGMHTYYAPNYVYGSSRPYYKFQGFIYPPGYVPPVPPTPEPKKKHFKWVLYANNFRNKRNI